MQVYSVDQIIDMGIAVAQKFKELNATITSYDGRVTDLENTDADTELRLVELESNSGGSGEVDINALKPDILAIIRAELEWYGVERSEYAGTGWYKDTNGRVYSKDVPSGETKKFPNDPNTYINILDSDLDERKLSTLVRSTDTPMFATSNLTKLSYDDYGVELSILSSLYRYNTNDVTSWDVGHITNFDNAFLSISDIIGLDKIDVSNMVSANNMLNRASPHKDTPTYISKWDTSKLTNGESMFVNFSFSKTTADSGLSSLDTSSLTNAKNMFEGSNHNSSKILDLSGWDVSKLVNAEGMFMNMLIPGDLVIGLDDWRVGNVTNMDNMLEGVRNSDIDLSKWCVTNIPAEPTGFEGLAANKKPVWGTCPYFGYGWYKDPVTGIVECNEVAEGDTHQFSGDPKTYVCTYIGGLINVENMDRVATSNVTSLRNVLYYASGASGKSISHWDLSKVTDMDFFAASSDFDSDMSNLHAPLIESTPPGFLAQTTIENDTSKHPQWGAQ